MVQLCRGAALGGEAMPVGAAGCMVPVVPEGVAMGVDVPGGGAGLLQRGLGGCGGTVLRGCPLGGGGGAPVVGGARGLWG